MRSTLTIRSAEENPRKTDCFVCTNHTFSGELFTLNHTFVDDLFAFSNTFMDELIRTRKCTNTKKTRKKDEENTKETRNFAYFSSDEGENHRAKTAR